MTFLGSKNKSAGGRCPFVPRGYMPDSMAGRTCETGVCDALQARRRERTNIYIDNDTEAMDTYIQSSMQKPQLLALQPYQKHTCTEHTWLPADTPANQQRRCKYRESLETQTSVADSRHRRRYQVCWAYPHCAKHTLLLDTFRKFHWHS